MCLCGNYFRESCLSLDRNLFLDKNFVSVIPFQFSLLLIPITGLVKYYLENHILVEL
jgi:hypothetical protein